MLNVLVLAIQLFTVALVVALVLIAHTQYKAYVKVKATKPTHMKHKTLPCLTFTMAEYYQLVDSGELTHTQNFTPVRK